MPSASVCAQFSMTSLAFGLGVLPLMLSSGAGSGSQNAIGTGIVGGAITTTLLGLFFVPLYFVTVLKLFRVKSTHPSGERNSPSDAPAVPTALALPLKAKKEEPAHV